MAFQRISERTRRSIEGSPGSGGSSSRWMVLTYGVGPTYSIAAPRSRARSTTRSTRSWARRGPSFSTTASRASSHSSVSTASISTLGRAYRAENAARPALPRGLRPVLAPVDTTGVVGEPGESDGALTPEWPSGPVYGQVPPPPPPAKPEAGPSREAWALALIAFAAALAFVASRHHGYDSGYELGGVLGTGAVSLVIATLLRHIYIRVVRGRGEAWHPWAIVIAAGIACWRRRNMARSGRELAPDGSIAAFGSEAAACRASAPSPLVTGGVVSFQPVDQATSQTVDAMLAQSSPAMEAQVQIREVSDGDLDACHGVCGSGVLRPDASRRVRRRAPELRGAGGWDLRVGAGDVASRSRSCRPARATSRRASTGVTR